MTRIHGRLRRMLTIIGALVLAGLCFYAGVVLMVVWKEKHVPEAEDFDAIVVLGAQVKSDGSLSVQLQWRLDKALEIWQENPVIVVTCGAQGSDEPAPEALVMRDYLVEKGVPADMVLTDPDSFNTRQNIRNAARLLEGRDVDTILIVTSDYHLPRAMALAQDEGLSATGVGSPTRQEISFWAKNHLREGLAWIKYWAVKYLHLPLE